MMIPPILHQTWKTDEIPDKFRRWSDSWLEHNPGWRRMFWTDRTLLAFVGKHYPDFLQTFCSYPAGIERADAARYLLLHHFGGVYADLDCECVAPFAQIMDEERVVLCHEPAAHLPMHIPYRGMTHLLFNGTMASPAGHPFWLHLASYLPGLAGSKDVLDATGPCVLTSAQISYLDQSALAIHPPALFAPLDNKGLNASGSTDVGGESLSVHHWAGTWLESASHPRLLNKLKRLFYRATYLATRGAQLSLEEARAGVDPEVLGRVPPEGGNIAVLVPLRDASEHIGPFLDLLQGQDYPCERIKLVFCEGDSSDGSWEKLQSAVEPLRHRFRDIVLLQKCVGTRVDRKGRHKRGLQRVRRTGLAKVRNHIIENGLDDSDDWALWIDIDVWRFPDDVIETLIGTGRRIVVPNCVLYPNGGSFDHNSFVSVPAPRDHRYYRDMRAGLHQPSAHYQGRRVLSDVRHLDRIDLDGVGGTMLLVDAALHRGGLVFPEEPYKDLVETEGFGVLAKDLGVRPLGLPRVEILHVPW
ncbi:glycosyltransferase [Mesorhizobium sp. 10J20-29]